MIKKIFNFSFLLVACVLIPSSVFSMTFEKRQRRQQSCILVHQDNKTIGSIFYEIFRNKLRREGYINTIDVVNPYQKKGLGTKLIQHALDDMREKNCIVAKVDSLETSVGFYKKMGFKMDIKNFWWWLPTNFLWIAYGDVIPMKYQFNKAKVEEKKRKQKNRRIETFQQFREKYS